MSNIEFQALDWHDYNATQSQEQMVSDALQFSDSDSESDSADTDVYLNRYVCQVFGRTIDGKSVAVTIDNYTPFYFVQVPDNWKSTHVKLLVTGLKSKMPSELSATMVPDKCKLVRRMIFNGFTNKELFKFARLVFVNSSAIKYSRKIFSRAVKFEGLPYRKYDVFEATLDSLLQLIQVREVGSCGWIQANNCRPNPLVATTADISVICKFTDLHPLIENSISPIKRLSYDIECVCQCDDEGFPNYRRRKDPIIQIGATFRIYPHKSSYLKAIVTQKKCDPIDDPNVEVYDQLTEKQLLLKFRDLINRENPDILYGYNTSGFDDLYIYERAKLLGIEKEFMKMSRNRYFPSRFQEKKLSSSGLGQNILKFIGSIGRINIDVMKVIQRDDKLPNYKLDSVSEHYLGDHKEDLGHKQLFANFIEGKPEQIREIAVYCIKDCELVHDLVDYLNIIPNNMSMSSVSIVPLSYIFMRGQGIKIYSLTSARCRKYNTLIKDIGTETDNEKFAGAYVYEPEKAQLFKDPVVVLDFNSLYPSIMIAENFSQDTLVDNPKYDNLPGIKYNTYSYTNPETGVVKQAKYVDHIANPELKGILPMILEYLLDERKETRVQIKVLSQVLDQIAANDNADKIEAALRANERLPNTIRIPDVMQMLKNKEIEDTITLIKSKIMILDAFQLAFKITANSIYGQCGSSFSKIRCKAISACVTAHGKKMLQLSQKHAEDKYGAECIYGDSITAETLVPIKFPGGNALLIPVGKLARVLGLPSQSPNKTRLDLEGQGYQIWSETGWTPIKQFIAHTTNKAIYRIDTDAGLVDVTTDHSLLLTDGTCITPEELVVGQTELMTTKEFPFKVGPVFMQAKGIVRHVWKLRENIGETVYDFETENHHFCAGVGRLVVHNTDSVFLKFDVNNVVDPNLSTEENNLRKRVEAKRLGTQAAKEITAIIGRYPMNLAFEKVAHPLLILRKKRYMYKKYEEDMAHFKFIAMGVLLKRRDNSPIVQTIYRHMVDILMDLGSMKDVVNYLARQFMKFKRYNDNRRRLKRAKYIEHLKLFTTSKTLKSREKYKYPERIEHRVLADRMAKRDPGNPPKPNDRIQFIYIKKAPQFDEKGKKIKILQGDRIETPEYILENNLEVDYKFYLTNKLKTPIMEILQMVYTKERTKEIYNKLIEKYDSN